MRPLVDTDGSPHSTRLGLCLVLEINFASDQAGVGQLGVGIWYWAVGTVEIQCEGKQLLPEHYWGGQLGTTQS
jgi:hypothetical protein